MIIMFNWITYNIRIVLLMWPSNDRLCILLQMFTSKIIFEQYIIVSVVVFKFLMLLKKNKLENLIYWHLILLTY